MKDRLIELVDAFAEKVDVKEWYSEELDERLADHLLANGVILPPFPVKVGDKVYRLVRSDFRDFFIREEEVWIVDNHFFAGLEIITKYIIKNCSYFRKIENEAFGKTVFLTREEAEKALKERSEI